ncbi:MAG: KH domain-containing protein [Desulfovibrio sp.]|nr:KH domain-containing protein [Desulfovibrio sp.]
MKDLVLYIARSLVDHPEAVGVEEAEGGPEGTVLKLSMAKDDLGKIIGRQGRTARALRTLVNAASARQERRVVLEIQE